MANDFGGLSVNLETAKNNLFEKSNRIRRAGAVQADSILVISTPVDTGLARSNWLPSIDQPRSDVVGSDGNSPRPKTLNFTEWSNIGVTTPIFLTNNVEYIEDLNNGSSEQVTAGFVERAIQASVEIMKQVK